MKRIFVTGQCTLHWGRLQYGNIGNYYIVEPLFRELHRVFPNAEIATTFQMTDEFIKNENVKVLPMDLFYGWKENDIEIAKIEFEIAKNFNNTGE
ncbi:MAG: polysaccharide pyruvyl transferase family protein, partial [bacterium]|nr:polysaccharide pyruvyl transferase family protein [bacterium]